MTTPNGSLIPLASATSNGLDLPPTRAEFEKTATFLASEYQEATASIQRHMTAIQEQCQRLATAFAQADDTPSSSFAILFHAGGRSFHHDDERLFEHMRRHAWQVLVRQLGILNIMSVKQREQFEKQLQDDQLPDITPETVLGLVGSLAGQVKDFAQEACREVFDLLMPGRSAYYEKFRCNDPFRIGRKVILSYYVEHSYDPGKFQVRYYHEKHVRAIDAVFHLLAGRGVIRDGKPPLLRAIEESEDGKGETEFFVFKCFKRGTLHLAFKKLDLVKQLNLKAAGEYVLGADAANLENG